jgi:hypothetical protein
VNGIGGTIMNSMESRRGLSTQYWDGLSSDELDVPLLCATGRIDEQYYLLLEVPVNLQHTTLKISVTENISALVFPPVSH